MAGSGKKPLSGRTSAEERPVLFEDLVGGAAAIPAPKSKPKSKGAARAAPGGEERAAAKPAPHFHGHRDRLRARFADNGAEALADYELLELLLFRAIPRRDVKPLAKMLIGHFGDLAGVFGADLKRLAAAPGMSERTALELKLVQAVMERVLRGEVAQRPVISSWSALLTYVRTAMGREAREQFRVLYLDKKNKLIADEVAQTGTVDHTPVYPREVMRRALELSASAVILVHNHPSGDPTPSKADIAMTQEIVEAGKPLRIAVHDHLVVGAEQVASFKALGLL